MPKWIVGAILIVAPLCSLVDRLPVAPAADPPKAPADFKSDGVAFLKKHCLSCHGEKKPKADLSLHGFVDDASLLKDRKVWQGVIKMIKSGEMPPEGKPKPELAEVEAFLASVQDVFARADKHGRDPGQVTVRRLNRAEYNNTVRDLIGVDFNPAEDFPADGVGYGFDNIGDVLSLSPVLLERYLAAAETISQRLHITPPRPPRLKTDALFLVPQGRDIKDKFRPIATGKRRLDHRNPAGLDGEYRIRARVFGDQVGDEPVKAAIWVDNKEVKVLDVKADSIKNAEVIETTVTFDNKRVETHVGITLKNEFKNADGARTLWVEYIELIPPADGRPAAQRKMFPVETGKRSNAEKSREILTRFATKAYRRPATPDEVDRLMKVVEAAEKRGKKWDDALKLGLQAVLVSPKFIFRVELDNTPPVADAPGSPTPIDEYQLASRLSYFLWSSMPDEELFALAEKKELSKNLQAQVRRMLQDPKAKALVDNFAMQWLQLRRLQIFNPDAKLFPTFNEPLRKAMLTETEMFFEAIIKEDRSVLDLIDADFTFLNEPLAKLYGITDTNGNRTGRKATKPAGKPIRGEEFQRVTLGDKERGGILTQASVLTVTSNPTRTSPVKRGHWVLDQILGTPPPPPPPNVPELPETQQAVSSGTLRQRLEQHRVNPACANCHARIDPIGFAFENYNTIGAYRTKDGTFDIDPSGTLPDGKKFTGPTELKAILKAKKELFARCLAEKMLTYALGRGVEYYDTPTIDRITAALAKDDYKFSTLVTEIVQSDPFRLRRGKEQSK